MRQVRKYRAVWDSHGEYGYPVEPYCDILHISRNAYYRWFSGKKSYRQQENEQIAEIAEKIHTERLDKGYLCTILDLYDRRIVFCV